MLINLVLSCLVLSNLHILNLSETIGMVLNMALEYCLQFKLKIYSTDNYFGETNLYLLSDKVK